MLPLRHILSTDHSPPPSLLLPCTPFSRAIKSPLFLIAFRVNTISLLLQNPNIYPNCSLMKSACFNIMNNFFFDRIILFSHNLGEEQKQMNWNKAHPPSPKSLDMQSSNPRVCFNLWHCKFLFLHFSPYQSSLPEPPNWIINKHKILKMRADFWSIV